VVGCVKNRKSACVIAEDGWADIWIALLDRSEGGCECYPLRGYGCVGAVLNGGLGWCGVMRRKRDWSVQA
jgi:hypothetical protein